MTKPEFDVGKPLGELIQKLANGELVLRTARVHSHSYWEEGEPGVEYTFETALADRKPKPKHYVLPMEGTKLADGTIAYATLDHTGVWTIKAYSKKQSAVAFHNTVTQAEIDAAPDWVKAITPAEVTDDEQ